MDDVIEAVHELHLLHITDYDGAWEGFDPGDPVEGAEEAAEKLVTVRALESTLGIDRDDAGPTRTIDDEKLEEELSEIRNAVNELDDRRSELRTELRRVDERIDAATPFAELGIDLDLLSGYDSLSVAVGEGDESAIRDALENADGVDAYETFSEGGYVAAFVAPVVDIEEALVGAAFTRYEVPDLEESEATSPQGYIEQLRHERQRLEMKLEDVEGDIQRRRHDDAGFLLAAEEKLSIEVQKLEAPLTFATTKNAFIAEGWVPTDRFDDLEAALRDAAGESIEVEELERAAYDDGHAHEPEAVDEEDGQPVAADGGHAMSGGAPPVIQDNNKASKPFEMLVGVINRPRYNELDPTLVLFLTFPAFFGFMIGDVGYGILYCAIGYVLLTKFDSPGFRSLGGVALWSGVFTIFFGVLYGEFFGLHELGYMIFGEGGSPMEKGLSPANIAFAQLWLVVSLLLGIVHLTIGHVFGFFDDLSHGIVDAVTENLSWVFLMVGVWTWVFSTHTASAKPEFLIGEENIFRETYGLAFTGLPEVVGLAALGLAALGFVLLLVGEGGIGLLESLNVLVNVLSYTRIAAVLLAKAGMAFVVNLLVFGAYETPDGGVYFLYNNDYTVSNGEVLDSAGEPLAGELMFAGLLTGAEGAAFIVALLAGAVIFVIGHILVLILGITSAGLQGIRLEYVEFFNKFYQGGGKPYQPFGYDRQFTAEE